MAILVVGGSTKDIGKTALVCAIISALRDFDWTAVKITALDHIGDSVDEVSAGAVIREETTAGSETDTSRYLAAGARRALLVMRSGAEVPVEEIRRAVGADRNVIYESNRIVDAIEPDVCLALVADPIVEWKPSFVRFLRRADALVSFGFPEIEAANLRTEIPRFALQSKERLTPEMVDWLRSRLNRSQMRNK
ncbi:MAG: hypothetical protein WCA10_07970 [Terracidiphilus sp.]